jgi:hypothetical protein
MLSISAFKAQKIISTPAILTPTCHYEWHPSPRMHFMQIERVKEDFIDIYQIYLEEI